MMGTFQKTTDCVVEDLRVYLLPVETRVPLKFGASVMTTVMLLRVQIIARNQNGKSASGWGETPLSAQWAWPDPIPFENREAAMIEFATRLAEEWRSFDEVGHPMEIGSAFISEILPRSLDRFNAHLPEEFGNGMPWLAALICNSAFDVALHDAYGVLNGLPTYATYTAEFMNRDLESYFGEAPAQAASLFRDRFPSDYFRAVPQLHLPVWHLVGGLDPIYAKDLSGNEPEDGYPVTLDDWVIRDGLRCLKVKLRGDDYDWDLMRLVAVGALALQRGVNWLSADFNCTVTDPEYVVRMLDELLDTHPAVFAMLLYIEQPFGYDIGADMIDVRAISARKPLFMDESAHDWQHVRIGQRLGWTGVALKTCKTQTGALLSLCWAREHGMTIMVQDLTNPMLAQIPHVLLAAHAGTIMGVESNAMQFYPEASLPEAQVHPELYRRRSGMLNLESISGPGFGYRIQEIERELPDSVA